MRLNVMRPLVAALSLAVIASSGTVSAGATERHSEQAIESLTTVESSSGVVVRKHFPASNGTVSVTLDRSGKPTAVTVDANSDHGSRIHETFTVHRFTKRPDTSYLAELRSNGSKEPLVVDTAKASQQFIPAAVVLGLLARAGLSAALKWYGKTQVKKAAKSYLLKQNAQRWKHIMDPKHKWSSVGAKSREQVAELMARAMSEGSHRDNGRGAKVATWKYRGKVIQVTYSKGGQISNGWVR